MQALTLTEADYLSLTHMTELQITATCILFRYYFVNTIGIYSPVFHLQTTLITVFHLATQDN
jgi:hypothetical protein